MPIPKTRKPANPEYFPQTATSGKYGTGVFLRDQIAMAALTGLLANSDLLKIIELFGTVKPENAAAVAYLFADEMLKVREK